MKKFFVQFRIYLLVLTAAMFLAGAESFAGESSKANPGEIQRWRRQDDELPGLVSPAVLIALGVATAGLIVAIIILNSDSNDDTTKSVAPEDSPSEKESQDEQGLLDLSGGLQSSTDRPSLSLFDETNPFKGVPSYRPCLRSAR